MRCVGTSLGRYHHWDDQSTEASPSITDILVLQSVQASLSREYELFNTMRGRPWLLFTGEPLAVNPYEAQSPRLSKSCQLGPSIWKTRATWTWMMPVTANEMTPVTCSKLVKVRYSYSHLHAACILILWVFRNWPSSFLFLSIRCSFIFTLAGGHSHAMETAYGILRSSSPVSCSH